MSKFPHQTDAEHLDVALLALMYASGEMDAAQSAAFEQMLGENQRAREALAVAVERISTTNQKPLPKPSVTYRQKVRDRMHPPAKPIKRRSGLVDWATRPRQYPGHPVVWSAVGAAAAIFILVGAAAFMMPTYSVNGPSVKTPKSKPGAMKSLSIRVPFEGNSAKIETPNDAPTVNVPADSDVLPMILEHGQIRDMRSLPGRRIIIRVTN